MSNNYALKAEARDRAGKGAARALRREDKVPAVIYGDGKESVSITLPSKEINLEYRKGHMFTSLCDLDIDGKTQLVLARDVQLHVVKDTVQHVDFLRVTPKTKIAVFVPVHFINEDKSPARQNKAVMNVVRHEIELLCQATSIPEEIVIDVGTYDIGDAVKISDVKLPDGTKPVINRDFTIATFAAPRAVEIIDTSAPAEGVDGAAPAEAAAEKAEGDKK